MTLEESKIEIQDIIDIYEKEDMYPLLNDRQISALKMAISALQAQEWIPCKERLPEEDHWLGGSGKQFSDNVLISITNREDADAWSDISQTIDGEWGLELPRYCKITAWKPLPEPYRGDGNE